MSEPFEAPPKPEIDFGLVSYDKLVEKATGPIPYIMEDFIPSQTLGIFVGNWGIGKSPFALQMQLSLAAGVPFLGRYKPMKPESRVLYIDLENGAAPVLNIVATLCRYLGLEVPPPSWTAYSPNYSTKPDSLTSMPEDSYVLYMLQQEKFDFIIIDPLRMFKPEAESKNSEAALLIRKLRKIINATGCSIMLVHHPRKPSSDELASTTKVTLEKNPTEWLSQACGAAALIQNTDYRIGLEENEDGYLVLRRFMRNRGWMPSEYISRVFDEDTEEPVGFTIEAGSEHLDSLERTWLNQLNNPFTTAQAKQELQKHHEVINRWLKRLCHLGVIEKVGRGLWHKV